MNKEKRDIRSIRIDKPKLQKLIDIISNYGLKKTEPKSEHELCRFIGESKHVIIYKSGAIVLRGIDEYSVINSLYPIDTKSIVIGCDEAGKGEPTGSIFCAGVALTKKQENILRASGVMDSKELNNDKICELVNTIRENSLVVRVLRISPSIILVGKKRGLSINDLLTKAYSYIIEKILIDLVKNKIDKDDVFIIVDEYSSTACNLLAEKYANLISLPYGEKFISVAAASIIARAHYLLEKDKEKKPWVKKNPD